MDKMQEERRKSIGSALKSWIESKYGNKAEFARKLGVTPQYVSGLCAGKTIGKEMAYKMRNLFGLSSNFLLTGEGDIEITSEEKKVIYEFAVAKGNRFAQVLDYLVSCGAIENWMEISQHLNVTNSVIKKIINYDPNGDFDVLFVKLCQEYKNISLIWLLTGEGSMLADNEPKSIDQSSLINAALAAKDGLIAAKDEVIRAKDAQIVQLQQSLQEKDQVIADLRRTIAILQYQDESLKKHAIPLGLAEDKKGVIYDEK